MPLRVFSLFNSNIHRIQAEEDQRLLMLLVSADSPDAAKKMFDRLEKENGNPIQMEKAPDPDAFEKLKALSEKLKNGNRTSSN